MCKLTVGFSFSVVQIHLTVCHLNSDNERTLIILFVNEERQDDRVVFEIVLELLQAVLEVVRVIEFASEVSRVVHYLVLSAKGSAVHH